MLWIIEYLFKLSITLAIVWIFYQLVLRRLTFYNSNRWYLLGYTSLSFFIPFINISPVVEATQLDNNNFIRIIPAVQTYTSEIERITDCPVPLWSYTWDKWDWSMFIIAIGAAFLLLRFLVRFISYLHLRSKATLIYNGKVKLYEVEKNIIPFSFGGSIFINRGSHSDEELKEIIRHEFIHVKQKHTVDIIWAEILCMLNWYNPFAWLLKISIRQNLEFIADNKVLENGINRKQYQYLLLKVTGNNHFSIAQKFNFSSLKKRIAMMNKLKTAKIHMLRFLFLVPLLAVILVSFRKQISDQKKQDAKKQTDVAVAPFEWTPQPTESEKDFIRRHPLIEKIDWAYVILNERSDGKFFAEDLDAYMTIHFKNGKADMYNLDQEKDVERFKKNYGENPPATLKGQENSETPFLIRDTIPGVDVPNEKGYLFDFIGKTDNSTIVVKDKNGKVVERIPYEKWDNNRELYENKYGELPPPPEPALPANPPNPPQPPQPMQLPENVKKIDVNNKKATVVLKDGKTETYDLNKPAEKAAFEKKYGEILPVPPRPPREYEQRKTSFVERNSDVKDLSWRYDGNVHMIVLKKDGSEEVYHIDDPVSKAKAEKKYGELPIPEGMPRPGHFESPELTAAQEANRSRIADHFEINDNKAYMRLKDGSAEEYDLNNKEERNKFEDKYGKLIEIGTRGEGLNDPVKVVGYPGNKNVSNEPITVVGHQINKKGSNEPITVVGHQINKKGSDEPVSVIGVEGARAGIAPARIAGEGNVVFLNDEGNMISGEEDILVTISNKTTQQQLTDFIKQMKEKGIELVFSNTTFNNGKLVQVSGRMKYNDGEINFSATDFKKVILSKVKDGDHLYMKVQTDEGKQVI